MHLTTKLRETITGQEEAQEGKTTQQIKNERRHRSEEKLNEILKSLPEEQKRMNEANKEIGASNWLSSLPLKDLGYELNKEQFRDALRIRYNWNIPRLPSECACGCRFDLSHALSCKKGGFVTLRHNEVRNITSNLLKEVCRDVRVEPSLLELNGEQLNRQANTTKEARLDISATGFWIPGQRVFLDVRVFDLNARRYRGLELKKCYKRNEDEKKKKYNERVLQVENGTFTPLVFSSNGGMARECQQFYKRLSEMISEKRNISTAVATKFIRTKISFSLLRSTLLCLRGSRSLRSEPRLTDMELSNINSHIQETE